MEDIKKDPSRANEMVTSYLKKHSEDSNASEEHSDNSSATSEDSVHSLVVSTSLRYFTKCLCFLNAVKPVPQDDGDNVSVSTIGRSLQVAAVNSSGGRVDKKTKRFPSASGAMAPVSLLALSLQKENAISGGL